MAVKLNFEQALILSTIAENGNPFRTPVNSARVPTILQELHERGLLRRKTIYELSNYGRRLLGKEST